MRVKKRKVLGEQNQKKIFLKQVGTHCDGKVDKKEWVKEETGKHLILRKDPPQILKQHYFIGLAWVAVCPIKHVLPLIQLDL